MSIEKALTNLRPNSSWIIRDGVLEWLDKEQTKPTQSEIDAEVSRLKSIYDATQYQRDRVEAYPTWQEQLDLQYWDKVNGTNKWQESVAKVKADNPKPE